MNTETQQPDFVVNTAYGKYGFFAYSASAYEAEIDLSREIPLKYKVMGNLRALSNKFPRLHAVLDYLPKKWAQYRAARSHARWQRKVERMLVLRRKAAIQAPKSYTLKRRPVTPEEAEAKYQDFFRSRV